MRSGCFPTIYQGDTTALSLSDGDYLQKLAT